MKLFILLFALSFYSHAKRYVVPSDDKVLIEFNQANESYFLNGFDLNVLVWNIYKAEKSSFQNEFSQLSHDSDLLILQESYLSLKLKKFFNEFEYQFIMATSFIDTKKNNIPTGVMTGSRVKAISSLWQRSYYREPFIKTPKMALFSTYNLSGVTDKLLIGNIHGINFVTASKLKHMLIEAKKVIAKHKGPVVFAGDFNTWTNKKLKIMRNIFRSLGFTAIKFKNDRRKRFMGKPLDHIWVKGLKVIESHVGQEVGSDHAPMQVRLTI